MACQKGGTTNSTDDITLEISRMPSRSWASPKWNMLLACSKCDCHVSQSKVASILWSLRTNNQLYHDLPDTSNGSLPFAHDQSDHTLAKVAAFALLHKQGPNEG
jgi:hypothetical protein